MRQMREGSIALHRRVERFLLEQRGVPVDAHAIMVGVGMDRDQRLYEAMRTLAERGKVERCKSARLHRWVYRTPSDAPWPAEHAYRQAVTLDAELPDEISDVRERRVRTRFPDDRESLSDRYVPLTLREQTRLARWARGAR